MKKSPYRIAALIAGTVVLGASAHGAVIFNEVSSGTETAYDANASAADLINAGAATLLSSTLAPTALGAWPPSGINNGAASQTLSDGSIYIGTSGSFPAVSTFNLDVSVNALGYNITSIVSIVGWNGGGNYYGNQQLTVEFSTIDSAAYTTLFANHDYSPFTGSGTSMVTVTDDGGILASGVDSIRVTYDDPSVGGHTLIRELDIFGAAAVVPEPSSLLLAVLGSAGIFAMRRRVHQA